MAKVYMTGRMKDGGTQRINYKGIDYWIDFRIKTSTPGSIYDDYPDKGKKVHKSLSREIYAAIQKDAIDKAKRQSKNFGAFG